MVAQGSKGNEHFDSGEALMHRSPADAALAADNAGKKELIEEQKRTTQQQKEGKVRTGVTKDFGILLLTGMENIGFGSAAQAMRAKWLESKDTSSGQTSTIGDVDPGFTPKGTENTRDIDPGFVPKGTENTRDIDPGFVPKGTENARDIDPGFVPNVPEKDRYMDFTPVGPEKASDIDPGFVPKGTENTRDIDPGFTPVGPEKAHDIDPGFTPAVRDNNLNSTDAWAQPTTEQTEKTSPTPEQQKAAKETALELAARFFLPGTDFEAVRTALYGKTEAELKAIDAAFKEVSGEGLEQKFKAEFQGAELDQALAMLKHQDRDLVRIPEGVDRAALIKTAEAIHEKVGGWLGGPRILKDLLGEKPEEIKALVTLYKDMYGIELVAQLKDELSAGEFEQISKLLPQTTETKDHSRIEVVQGKVLAATAADGHGREFKYDGGQLTEVKSTFTGHTWKRSEVDGKEAWVNEKGTVWKGKFSVGPDGNLSFTRHDGKGSFIFTADGQTHRVPAESHTKAVAHTDTKGVEKPAAPTEAKAAEKPAAATEAKSAEKPAAATDAKAAEKPAAVADAKAAEKPVTPAADSTKEPAPLNAEQQKSAQLTGLELAAKFSMSILHVDEDDVRQALYGKTEAELRAIDATFKERTGKGLAETFKEEFQGAELDKALEMLNHKDNDLLPLPEGVDRAKVLNANSLIVQGPDVNASNTTEDRPASYQSKIDPKSLREIFEGKTPAELQAMNALFKDLHGITLEEYLQKNAFVPLGSLDKYAKEANDARAAKDNFEIEVGKVDQAKIAEAAKTIHDSTGKVENFALSATQEWNRPHLGDHPAQKAIQNFTPAQMEALKRHYKAAFGEDVKERVKDVPFFGDSLVRTLDRPPYSAMNAIPVEKQAALREETKKLYATMEYADGTDEKGYYKLLEGKSAAERAAIIEYYHELTGDSLERRTIDEFKEDAAELEKALNYLRIGSEVESANLHLALTENDAARTIERVTTLTPAQLLEADKDIKAQYGKSLRELIQTNEGMTQEAKEALLIYVDSANRQPGGNGRKMTDEEYARAIELSLHATKVVKDPWGNEIVPPGNLKMFQNIMADAPQAVRDEFLKEGGEAKIEAAFLDDGSQGDAEEYAKFGRLSTERKLHKCDRVDDDERGAVKALDDMDPKTERGSYLRGARIYKERFLDTLSELERNAVMARTYGESFPSLLPIPEFNPSSLAPPLTAEQLKDCEKFRSINAAIDKPADDEEHRDWRDHAVYAGGVDKAKEFIGQLPFEKLQEIKASAQAREKFVKENHFDLLSEHAQKQIFDLLDKKLLAQKPEDLKYAEGKALKDVLKLDDALVALYGPGVDIAKERQKIVEGVMQMTLADQQKYRQDAEFRSKVDERVKTLLDESQQKAVMHMLDSVAKGGYPVGDWIDNINIEAGKNETSEPQVIRFVEEQFRKDHERVEQLKREGKPVDPAELRERICNPKTPEDQALKERLEGALHKALDGDEYEKWAKPALENGKLSFEQKIQLDKEKGEKEDVYKDVAALATAKDAASIEERHHLATDANYRQQVLGHLPAEERELAEKIIKQSTIVPVDLANALAGVSPEQRSQIVERLKTDETYRQELLPELSERDQRQAVRVLELGPVLPEDAVRAYKIGAQPSKEEMMATLREVDKSAAHEKDLKAAYADAFHHDIGADLASKLEGQDKSEMERLLRENPKTGRELYLRTVDEAEAENSGVAAQLTQWWGSQAGDMAEDTARQMYVKLARAAERGEEIPVDDKELQALAKSAQEYSEIFAEAKQASVDAVVGIALSVATIAVPGGLSLKLLYWTVGGGIGKVAMKAALLGDEYDGKIAKDFISGAVDTAFSAVGGAQIAKVLKLGSKVGAQASRELLESAVVKPLIKEGEQVLQKTLQRAVAEEIAHGGGMISDQAIAKIVNKVAKEGASDAEKAILQESVKTSLTNAIKSEVRQGAQKLAHDGSQFVMRKGLDAGAGYVGGFAGGFTGGLFEWDASKSWDQNLGSALDAGLQAGKGGLVGGAGFSIGFSVVGTVARHAGEGAGKAWHIIRGKDVQGPTHLSNPEQIASAGHFAVVRSKDAPHPSAKDRGIEVAPDAMKSLLPVGKTGYFVGEGGVLLKKVEDLPNGNAKLVPDRDAALIARADVAAKLENRSAKVAVDMDAPGVPAHGAKSAGPEAQPLRQAKAISSEGKLRAEASGEIGGASPRHTGHADTVSAPESAKRRGPAGGHSPEIDDPALLAVGDKKRLDLPPAPRAQDTLPMVKQVLDSADIPPAERAALLSRINESKLAKAEVMDDFARRASDITSGWNDASDLPGLAKASYDEMKGACHDFQDKLLARIQLPEGGVDKSLLPLLDNPVEARKVFKDDPEIVRAADDYITKRALHAESQRVFHDILQERVGEMQQLLDKLADEQGLPRVKLEAGDEAALGPFGDGRYDQGTLVLKQDMLLRNSDPASLLDMVYHEFTHHEQANLMIRGVIDDIEQQIGATVTGRDLDRFHQLKNEAQSRTLSSLEDAELDRLESQFVEIRQLYLEKTGNTLPSEQLTEVLRARQEQRLTPAERARAESLYGDWKKMENPGDDFARAGTDLKVTNSELEKLDDVIGAMSLLSRLGDDNGTLSRRLFDQDIPPAEIQALIRTYKKFVDGSLTEWPEQQAKFELRRLLEKQKETLEIYRFAIYKQYVSGMHELEAYVIGRTLNTRARDAGVPGHAGSHDAGTGVHQHAGGDDEVTGVHRRAGSDGQGDPRSNAPAGSADTPDLPGHKPEQAETPEQRERIAEWDDEPKTVADPVAQRPPIEKGSRTERPQSAPGDGQDASHRLVAGEVKIVPAGPDGTTKLRIEGREYDLVAHDGDVVYARVSGGRERPLGDPLATDVNNFGPGKEFQPIGDSGYYRDATTGDAYLMRRSADGSLEMVRDPNVKPLDPDLSRQVSEELEAFERSREWEADDPHRTSAYPQPEHAQRWAAEREQAVAAREQDLSPDLPKKNMTRAEELGEAEAKALGDLQGNRTVAGRDVQEEFPVPTRREHQQWRQELEADLREVPVDGAANVYDKIVSSQHLGPAQKARILDMLADVRAHYKRLEPGLDGYQGVNWKHTRGEIDQVLEAAVKRNLTPEQAEDAILASIFSDSVKFPPGDRANFIVHHVDGAKAAAEILPRYFDVSVPDNMARVEGIYRAILEHQIAPPGFMANMAANNMIGGKLRGMLGLKPGEPFPSTLPDGVIEKLGQSVHGFDAQKLAEFRQALHGQNPKEIMQSIQQKMQYPLDPRFRTIDPETGIATTNFTPAERALLETIGVKDWFLPNPDNAWYGASRAVIDGDGLINYATPDGWAKIAAIRGPGKEPWFQDATVFDSLKTAKQSYDDAFSVMTQEGQDLARAGLGRTEGALDRVRQKMEDWFNSPDAIGLQRNADGTIPFWNADLKYPPRGPAPKFELQLDQLSDVERKQFEFALKIRERMVEELRKEQSVFMKGPGGNGGPGGGQRKK